jgi:hypothetical protein
MYVHFASWTAMFRSLVASLMPDSKVGSSWPMKLLYIALSVDSLFDGWLE